MRRGGATPCARVDAGEQKPGEGGRILESFAELRPDEQMALSLRVVERLKYSDIAALLDTSLGAAMVRLAQARSLLLGRTAQPGGNAS